MGVKNKYYKNYIILNQEDYLDNENKGISGYVRIKGINGEGQIDAVIDNVKGDNKENYKLYLIKSKGKEFHCVSLDEFKVNNNKGSIIKNITLNNVKRSGLNIDQFNVVAVGFEDKQNKEVKFPLVGYTREKPMWKENAESFILKMNKEVATAEEEKKKPSKEVQENFEENVEKNTSKIQSEEIYVTESIVDNEVERGEYEKDIKENIESYTEEKYNSDFKNEDLNDMAKYKQTLDFLDAGHNTLKDRTEFRRDENSIFSKDENYLDQVGDYSNIIGDLGSQTYNIDVQQTDSQIERNVENNESVGTKKSISTFDLRKDFERWFKLCYPFNVSRMDYSWWGVNDIVQLDKILKKYDINEDVLFKSDVIRSFYRYGHLITGLYSDINGEREYAVIGVPSLYQKDIKPSEDMQRWVKVDNKEPEYGCFGYWLLYLDIK